MNYNSLEQICWPFVLLVGTGITKIEEKDKYRFWRDHTILSALIVVPIAFSSSLSAPLWLYMLAFSFSVTAYLSFVAKWRKYLAKHK